MLRLMVLVLLGLSLPVSAELKCDVDLRFGLVVNERQIRVVDEGGTLYQINDASQLIVQGEWLSLSDEQQQQLQALAGGIHKTVPKMIILATEGAELAVVTLEHVYMGLVGEDHKSYDKLLASLQKVKKRIREKFVHAGDNFYMGPGSLENVDNLVDEELEEIEQAIHTSLGGVLSAIGGLSSGQEQESEQAEQQVEETEQRLEELSVKIEVMGKEVERQVGPKADSLRHKARWFCNKMHQLDEIENKLRDDIAELAKFDVILTGSEHYH